MTASNPAARGADVTVEARVPPAVPDADRRHSLFDLVLDPLWDWDVRADLTTFSAGWYDMLGIEPSQRPAHIGPGAWERMVHPDDLPQATSRLEACLAGRTQHYEATYRVRTHRAGEPEEAGGWLWVRSRGRVVERDANGRPLRMIGSVTDITERRSLEERLRETDRFLWTLLSNLPGWAYRCRNDRAWTHEFGSEGMERITGYSADCFREGQGMTYETIIHPDDRRRVWDEVQAALDKREAFQLVYRITTRSGEEKWVWEQGRGIADAQGRVTALEGFITDITAPKRAELALRATEHRHEREFRALVEHAPDMIARFDRELRHIYVNPATEQAVGLPREAVIGRTIDDLEMPDALRERCRSSLRSVFKTGRELAIELEYPSATGAEYYESRFVPEFGEQGDVESVLAVSRDITQRKRAEAALKESSELQRLLLRELDHRVRNNLASLAALIDLSSRGRGSAAGSVEAFAASIQSRVQAMAVVHSLLSRSTSRTLSIRSLVHLLVPEDLSQAVSLRGPDLVVASRQATALGMVVQELVANSLKHGALGAGGRVTAAWGDPDADGRIHFTWRERGGPRTATPVKGGTGTKLITGLVRAELRGEATLRYGADGADHRLVLRLDSL